jgi:ring-1,2-phenylacetyl-CoA epoxidase subunit PaaD
MNNADNAATGLPETAQIWAWLEEVCDPEIPVISVVDLGIVRDVQWCQNGNCIVTITPTYSGCPAMKVIEASIQSALKAHADVQVEVRTSLSPAWTTDWMSEAGKGKLKDYGVAPPAEHVVNSGGISRVAQGALLVACPQCGSHRTRCISQFGSTACKALYKCMDCAEPFDYFKCH